MKSELTKRGFSYYTFKDGYSAECSLQESSAARFEDEHGNVSDGFIWFGMDKEHDGFVPGREIKDHTGKMVKLGARMHLSQSTVRELLPLLEYFAVHGDLPVEDDTETIAVTLDARKSNNKLYEIRKQYHHNPTHPVYLLAVACGEFIRTADKMSKKAVELYNEMKQAIDNATDSE